MQKLREEEFHVNVVTEHIHGVGPVAKVGEDHSYVLFTFDLW
jgi:hypothetical protein